MVFPVFTHEFIENYLQQELKPASVIVLSGNPGCGKSTLAQRIAAEFDGDAITFIALRGKKDHSMLMNACGGNSLNMQMGDTCSLSAFWHDVLGKLPCGERSCLIVIDNAHDLAEIERFIALFYQAAIYHPQKPTLLLVGDNSMSDRKKMRKLCPSWIRMPSPATYDEERLPAVPGTRISAEKQRMVAKVAQLSRGNLRFMAVAAKGFQRYFSHEDAEKKDVRRLTAAVVENVQYAFPAARRTLALMVGYAVCAFALGWMLTGIWRLPVPVPHWINGNPPAIAKKASPPKITDQLSDERSSMQGLFSAWGYEVTRDEAWCDQAVRAGLICHSGENTLEQLSTQGLPWIARLEGDKRPLFAVVMNVSPDELDLLINQRIWTVKRHWFEQVWHGQNTILWKTAPDGATHIGRKSDVGHIIWLDAMLSKAMNIPATPVERWQPILTEKLKSFQASHYLPADGIAGRMTLIRLMQELGESPKLTLESSAQTENPANPEKPR